MMNINVVYDVLIGSSSKAYLCMCGYSSVSYPGICISLKEGVPDILQGYACSKEWRPLHVSEACSSLILVSVISFFLSPPPVSHSISLCSAFILPVFREWHLRGNTSLRSGHCASAKYEAQFDLREVSGRGAAR